MVFLFLQTPHSSRLSLFDCDACAPNRVTN
jgi:hypothetical protein